MDCPVCFGETASLTTRCGHSFCFPCMKQWLVKSGEETKPTCPMCRTTIRFKGLEKIEQSLAEERYDEKCQQVFGEIFDEAIESFTEWVGAFPADFSPVISRGVMRELKSIESTFRVMKELDFEDPDSIIHNIAENGVELNYKKEMNRDRRSMWNREKPAARYDRKNVMNTHR